MIQHVESNTPFWSNSYAECITRFASLFASSGPVSPPPATMVEGGSVSEAAWLPGTSPHHTLAWALDRFRRVTVGSIQRANHGARFRPSAAAPSDLMSSTLVRGKYVVIGVSERDEPLVVKDGAVFQESGTIVAVGPYDQLVARYQPDEVLGSPAHVVLPGLVNAHHHIGLTPLQLGSPDYPLELWITSRMAARDVDIYLDTLYSAFEMIESGVTTVQHLHGIRRGPVARWPDRAHQVVQAYQDIGMRVSYAFGIRDQNQIVYGSDPLFIRTLPPDLAAEVQTGHDDTTIDFGWARDLFRDLHTKHGRNRAERVRIWLAPTNLHWCSDPMLRDVKHLADECGVGIHMHLLETIYQKQYAHRRFRTSAVQHLRELEFLGPGVTLGHGVWLTDRDLDLVVETGTTICHNPSSNLRLQSGIAPLNEWIRRGIRVAIGIDEAGINDDRDMIQEMRLALHLHRVPGHDRPVPTAAQVFRMATVHGAHTTGFRDRIGTLEPGKAADLVVMRLHGIEDPYLDEMTPILDAIVQRGRSADVETVMIAGEVVLRERRFTRVDKLAVLQELRTALKAPLRPDEEHRRTLAARLLPYVRRFYQDWHSDDPRPGWYTMNARE
jgi:cytosine/adenosine deaminase-related metal-dependent hydrolase